METFPVNRLHYTEFKKEINCNRPFINIYSLGKFSLIFLQAFVKKNEDWSKQKGISRLAAFILLFLLEVGMLFFANPLINFW